MNKFKNHLLVFGVSLTILLVNSSTTFAKNEKNNSVCDRTQEEGIAHCHAHVIVDEQGNAKTNIAPAGYGPVQFRTAYGVSGLATSKQTIAIVDAYDDPSILSDLNTYSAQFGLPLMNSCPVSSGTLASPCFQKVNQRGGISLPRSDAGWSLEIALDVEIAHAMCQNCNILLVEADNNSMKNLATAVDMAATMGASAISNSYGGGEFSSETSYDSHYNHPGIAITVSSGDSGYGAEYPAASQFVTAIGGTTLNLNADNSYNSETVWSGSGSGCSAYELKPIWQTDSLCAHRTVADISADADPNTGAAVYDSVRYYNQKGWFKVGGTSLSSPLIAGIYALAGGVPTGVQGNSLPYSLGNSLNLNDITIGSNGACGATYLCTGTSGYDGPTGLGTPKGLGAF